MCWYMLVYIKLLKQEKRLAFYRAMMSHFCQISRVLKIQMCNFRQNPSGFEPLRGPQSPV